MSFLDKVYIFCLAMVVAVAVQAAPIIELCALLWQRRTNKKQ
jgi:hypothetical protein